MEDNMEVLETDDTLTRLTDLLIHVQSKQLSYASQIEDLIKTHKEQKLMDQSLMERLQILSDAHKTPLIKGTELPKFINENSIIIYFKSAKLFKVYKSSQLRNDIHNHLNNDFRRQKDMFEVIPDNLPQKIVIICDKNIIPHMNTLKKRVVEFMNGKNIEVKESDIKTFKNDGGFVEIIINGYYVSNKQENEQIVSELSAYIEEREKNAEITNKMNQREYNEYKGTKMVYMPNCKTELDGKPIEYVTNLVRNIDQCRHITTGNVFYVENLTIVGNNAQVGTITNNVASNTAGTLSMIDLSNNNMEEFISDIKNDAPDWFKENTWIKRNDLLQKYEEIYGSKPHHFFTYMENRLFLESKRAAIKGGGREYQVKLFAYKDVK